MKPVLLLIVLSLPLLATAQITRHKIGSPSKSLETQMVEEKIIDIEKAVWNSANPRYVVIKDVTPVYRQVVDTLGGHHYSQLSPNTQVYLRKPAPNGYWVSFGPVFSELYYLPAKSTKGLQTMIEI